MIWAKRRFSGVDYVPYMDKLEKLLLSNGALYREFLMVIVGKGQKAEYYVGLPNNVFMAHFDQFEPVAEAAVPKVLDTLLIGDNNEVNRRFQFRHNLPR